mmetsp:Transcript_22717/g.49171  ORF Transcript_22717/g.49171 Transcript_22717/m.49171 type:complete len:238 (-) Transcript_22717:1636-2349(-)
MRFGSTVQLPSRCACQLPSWYVPDIYKDRLDIPTMLEDLPTQSLSKIECMDGRESFVEDEGWNLVRDHPLLSRRNHHELAFDLEHGHFFVLPWAFCSVGVWWWMAPWDHCHSFHQPCSYAAYGRKHHSWQWGHHEYERHLSQHLYQPCLPVPSQCEACLLSTSSQPCDVWHLLMHDFDYSFAMWASVAQILSNQPPCLLHWLLEFETCHQLTRWQGLPKLSMAPTKDQHRWYHPLVV